MSKAFDPESGFISGFTKVVDTLVLSMLWLVCCVPIVTVGAASGAFYYAFHKAVRQDGGHACRSFFKAFRSNFKQATGIWLILLVFMLLSVLTCWLLAVLRQSLPMAGALVVMGVFIIGFAAVWCLYLFPYQARFENTVLNILKNSAVLAMANVLRSLLLLVIFGLAVILSLYKPAMCVPAAAVYIWLANKLLEGVFRRIMTEEALKSEMELDEN